MKGLFLLLVAAFILSGCAGRETPADGSAVSEIPWNKPESWEGKGPFGGLMPGGN